MITYPIHERFLAFQGEGAFMGQRAFFIRTYGCPLHCPFCDSAGTWHPDYVPAHIERMTATALTTEIRGSGSPRVIITGGEPAIFDWTSLICENEVTTNFHLETSGAFEIKGMFDWITVSPKRAHLPLPSSMRKANEYKLIIEKPEDIAYWLSVIKEHLVTANLGRKIIWLHPEWSHRSDAAVLNAITDAVKFADLDIRAGWQLHKLYKCDALDNRSAKQVPLGGNPVLGY